MLRKRKYVWNQVPLFRLIWPFLAGIITAIFVPSLFFAKVLLAFGVVLAVVGGLLHRWSTLSAVLLIMAAMALGYAHTSTQTERLFKGHYAQLDYGYKPHTFFAKIISDPIERAKSTKVEVEMRALDTDTGFHELGGRLMLYVQNDSAARELAYGDKLIFSARLNTISPPRNPAEFNYKRYMHFHQITHQAYVASAGWQLAERGSGFMRSVKRAQHLVIDLIEEHAVSQRELAIISALLVGYKHHLSADQVSAFASAGAMHVLAVSGLHVGIVFLIVMRLLKPFERWRWGKILNAIVLLSVLWGYAAITGLSPSVSRAATMFSFVIVGKTINRHTDIFNTIATSAVFLLILNPFLIVEVGFQLSYLAVLGIVLLQPRIYELWQPNFWIVDKLWAITAVSLAAQAATFPLGLLYFHQFPNYFLLSNLVVIPAATFILPLGIAMIALSWVPMLSSVLGTALYYSVHWLDKFIQWVEKLPFALIEGIDISIFETYFIYMIITTAVMFLISKRYVWLTWFLAMLCCIEVLNITEQWSQRKQKAIVVYDVKERSAIDLISGHDHVFIADSALTTDAESMRFHIHHHWWQRDLKAPLVDVSSLPIDEHLILFANKTLLVLDDSVFIDSIGEIDLLLINKRTQQHPIEVLRLTTPKHVVLTSRLDWKSANYWDNLLTEQEILYHNMRDQGAYVHSLE